MEGDRGAKAPIHFHSLFAIGIVRESKPRLTWNIMLYGRHWPLRGWAQGTRGAQGTAPGLGGRGQEKLRGSLWPWLSKAWLEADFAPPAALVVLAEVYLLLLQAQPPVNESWKGSQFAAEREIPFRHAYTRPPELL
jgi:hypothetical protein